jgi:alpha-tubulin suppressor-like RCC1 family protein
VPGLEGYEIRAIAAGWAHSAIVTTCGRLLVFGRPHDLRKALTLSHMWRTLPTLVRINQALKSE